MAHDCNERCSHIFGNFSVFILVVLIIVSLLFNIDYTVHWYDGKKLGQSICEEKYDMDYKSFDGETLECKAKPKIEKYDGIKIKIAGDTNAPAR